MDVGTAIQETEAFFVPDADRIEAGGADDAVLRASSDRTIAWKKNQPRRVFRCRVQVEVEETGYSAYVPALPGVLSEGETLAETLANIAEAIIASLESYLSSDDTAIPWQTIDDSPENEGSYWLAVNV